MATVLTYTVEIDSGLIAEAEPLGIAVQSTAETDLRTRITRRSREIAWQNENRDAIDAYNEEIEKNGMWYQRIGDL